MINIQAQVAVDATTGVLSRSVADWDCDQKWSNIYTGQYTDSVGSYIPNPTGCDILKFGHGKGQCKNKLVSSETVVMIFMVFNTAAQ